MPRAPAGYGLAFSFAILLVGWISAFFNPALALAAWINGNGITTAGEFFAISGSCILGDNRLPANRIPVNRIPVKPFFSQPPPSQPRPMQLLCILWDTEFPLHMHIGHFELDGAVDSESELILVSTQVVNKAIHRVRVYVPRGL